MKPIFRILSILIPAFLLGMIVLFWIKVQVQKHHSDFVSRHWHRQILPTSHPDRPERPSFEKRKNRSPKVHFDHPHGYYSEPFELILTTDQPDAKIWFSLDGSIPFPESSFGSSPESFSEKAEANGILFEDSIKVNHTTMITAISLVSGSEPSIPQTQTYLFIADILKQSPDSARSAGWPLHPKNGKRMDYGMDSRIVDRFNSQQWKQAFLQIPSISLVLHLDDLMDSNYGIYANPRGQGRGWECYTSVEFIEKNRGHQTGAGLRIRGGFTRNPYFPKHSFRLFFRKKYGAGKLKYPLFEEKGAGHFDKIDLRTAQNYSWAREGNRHFGEHNTLVRDVFCRDTQAEMGEAHTRSRYYHLFLNGLYWGIYMTEERPEAAYGASYFEGEREDFDTLKCSNFSGGYELEATDGTIEAWRKLWKSARTLAKNHNDHNDEFDDDHDDHNDQLNDRLYRELGGLDHNFKRDHSLPALVEIDNLINYMLIAFYAGNTDGPLSAFLRNDRSNNWFALRNRNGKEGFRFFVHDAEHTLGVPESDWDRTGPFHSRNQDHFEFSNPQWIHQDLTKHPAYRRRFSELAHQHLRGKGALTTARSQARFKKRAEQIHLAMRAQSARWGDAARSHDPYLISDWESQIQWVLDQVLYDRENEIIEQLKIDGLYQK